MMSPGEKEKTAKEFSPFCARFTFRKFYDHVCKVVSQRDASFLPGLYYIH